VRTLIFAIIIFSISVSCKKRKQDISIENQVLQDENYYKSQSFETSNKKLDFEITNNWISADEGIDSVNLLKLNTERITYFMTMPFSRIIESNNLYFGIPYEMDRLLVFDKNGEINLTIKANVSNKISPYRIGFFDVDPKNKLIYILDEVKFKIFVYDYDGKLNNTFDLPSNKNWYYKLFLINEKTLLLQTKGQPSNSYGIRDSSLVGDILDLNSHKMRPLYIKGGSQTRDMFLGSGFHQSTNNILFNYHKSRIIHYLKINKLVQEYEIVSTNFISDEAIYDLDRTDPENSQHIYDLIASSGKINDVRFVYTQNDILFIIFGYQKRWYWFFYNTKLNKYKIVKLGPTNKEVVRGMPIKHVVTNGFENSLLLFLDGEQLQEYGNLKKAYDANSTYLLKIYPKYLNQSAWE
jgi:hypothetical protein